MEDIISKPDLPDNTGLRNPDGTYRAGFSGNLAGRPKRSLNRISAKSQDIIEEQWEYLICQIVQRAIEGDWKALRFCAERIAPRSELHAMDLELPPINNADDAINALAFVANAACRGEITISEAESISGMICKYISLKTANSVEARLSALEQHLNIKTIDQGISEATSAGSSS